MSRRHTIETYPPLGELKPVAADIWIVDGPCISFGPPGLKFRFPTRMVVVRLEGDRLFLHSPTPISDDLGRQVRALGDVKWIIAPNRIHYWWLPEWKEAFPEADVYLAPKIREQARGRISFDANELDRNTGYPWDSQLSTIGVAGSFMTEYVFFHHASKTLLISDLIENFEPEKLRSWWHRWLTKLGGVQDPDGQMPKDLRRTFSKNLPALRQAVETMINWGPERVIMAHGRWYEKDGTGELRRAFRWLSD